MKILHTADWHLGHTLKERSRAFETAEFHRWLLQVIDEEQVDAVLIAGDIFETANPGAEAQEAWFSFVGAARAKHPHLHVVAIGGNHDSAQRLDAPSGILSHFGVTVVGGLPRSDDGSIDLDRVVVPIRSREGERAWVAAVPFLRVSDLPRGTPSDALAEGVAKVYGEIVGRARQQRADGEAIIAMGHLFMDGGSLSEGSERKVLGGNLNALPLDLFPDDIAYAALGHLHRAQVVGTSANVRYSGSPIPLSMAEATYSHQVCVVDIDKKGRASARQVPIPRAVEFRRFPDNGAAPTAAILQQLARLPGKAGTPEHKHAFIEVVVETDGPEPGLMERISTALLDKAAFLVKVSRVAKGAAPGVEAVKPAHREYTPGQVFAERYKREHNADPPDAYVRAFHDLLDEANQEGRP